MKITWTSSLTIRSSSLVILACLIGLSVASPAPGEEKWKSSFNEICSKVDASGSLSAGELAALIERLDKLAPEIKASGDPSGKIYLQRLRKCRSMYEFMIESKKEKGK